MKISLLVAFFLLSGCSTNLFKMKVVKREKIEKSFYYKKPEQIQKDFLEKTNWVALLVISNDYFPEDPILRFSRVCKKSDVISNTTIDLKYFFLIPVFGISKFTYEGVCHE